MALSLSLFLLQKAALVATAIKMMQISSHSTHAASASNDKKEGQPSGATPQ